MGIEYYTYFNQSNLTKCIFQLLNNHLLAVIYFRNLEGKIDKEKINKDINCFINGEDIEGKVYLDQINEFDYNNLSILFSKDIAV